MRRLSPARSKRTTGIWVGAQRKTRARSGRQRAGLWGPQHGDGVYATVIPDRNSHTLKSIIEQGVIPDRMVDSAHYHSDNVLAVSGVKHLRMNHSERLADKQNPIKGMENYQAKRPLHQFERDTPRMLPEVAVEQNDTRVGRTFAELVTQQGRRTIRAAIVDE